MVNSPPNPFAPLVERRRKGALEFLPDDTERDAPPPPLQREVRACPPPPNTLESPLTIPQARAHLRAAVEEYLNMEHPEHMLLLRAAPGLGKTTLATDIAELSAARGWRVGYAGPRHDFFADVTAAASQPGLWYEWLPRQKGSDEQPETCGHTDAMEVWLRKGYSGIDFCSGVCGWDYVNKACLYHLQKARPEPIIFMQHAHAALAHPLEFHVVIGDESPIGAFVYDWVIPSKHVVPSGMDYAEPLTEILHALANVCRWEHPVNGQELLDALGGAEQVLQACELFTLPADAVAEGSHIHSDAQAERADYFHLPQLVPLLAREARCAVEHKRYPPRIKAGGGSLRLHLRRAGNDQLPPHVIWLDATGDEHLYRELFHRPVEVVDVSPQLAGRVVVVSDRTNGQSDLTQTIKGEKTLTHRVAQSLAVVQAIIAREGHTRPGFITYQSVLGHEFFDGKTTLHFYAARGTNRLEQVDALFVLGAPMPPRAGLPVLASQIFFDRMQAFDTPWSARWIPYSHVAADGLGREYPAGGYWGDPDMEAVLWQLREAEILQAVHRARILHRAVTVYLFSNLPIPQLPVSQIVTMRELMDAPEGVDPFKWQMVRDFSAGKDIVTVSDVIALGVSRNTAHKYVESLSATDGWQLAAARTGKRGQPPKIAVRANNYQRNLRSE